MGFVDPLPEYSSVNHSERFVAAASNSSDAEPPRDGRFIVGIVMFSLVRTRLAKVLWLAWPVWDSFAVISTGNRYWLDIAADP